MCNSGLCVASPRIQGPKFVNRGFTGLEFMNHRFTSPWLLNPRSAM